MKRLLPLVLLAACGGGSGPDVKIDLTNRNGEFGEGETMPPPPCAAGEFLCDGTRIARCGADGTTRTPVFECGLNPVQNTCGSCSAGPACVAAEPLCSGTFAGLGASPWIFTTAGCGEFQCDAKLEAYTGGSSFRLDLGGGPFRVLRVFVGDMSRVTPGVPMGFLGSGNVTFRIEDHQGRYCTPYDVNRDRAPPPWSGSTSITWDGLDLGSRFTIDFAGPITCDFHRSEWIDVNGRFEAVLGAVE